MTEARGQITTGAIIAMTAMSKAFYPYWLDQHDHAICNFHGEGEAR